MQNFEGATAASPAPALERGLRVLEILQGSPALTLEELAQSTDIPKASLLRLLETLQGTGYVRRLANKRYRSIKTIIDHKDRDFDSVLQDTLRQLAQRCESTAEWYQRVDQGAEIRARYEPANCEVRVVANVGFIRKVPGELDAVAAVLLADRVVDAGDFWVYDAAGQRLAIKPDDLSRRLVSAHERGWALDIHYNARGVRRMAHVVRDASGTLIGILALAESFAPGADQFRDERQATLIQSAAMLAATL